MTMSLSSPRVKQSPKRDWLSFVITNKARTKIRQALNEEKVKAGGRGKGDAYKAAEELEDTLWRH
ncbi:MAG: hypothetical protein MZV63_22645 [Marinilabiliales bacterium]|nr:hypothetical protein [Marinilabiliales bacterium]